jgi:hypothetical protein
MRSLFQRRLALLATALAALVLPAAGRAAIQTRHVVIVVIDGARWTETLGDPTLTWHPRMGHDLAAIGAQPGLFQNVGVTNTMPGHAAILTGTLQNILNDGTERPHKPTLFEVLRKQKGTPDSLVRIVAYKAKLAAEAYSDDPAYGAAYGATVHAGFANDSATFVAGRQELLQFRPTLMHLGESDVYGHLNDWAGYTGALHHCDSLVWRLWGDIQADPVLSGRTTLFVTNDHGRHDDAHGGFQNHGDGCDGCRHIMMLMAGPDCRSGWKSAARHDQRAIALTAAYLLGVSIPFPDPLVNVMDDLLLEPSQPLAVPPAGARAPHLAVVPNPTRAGAVVRLGDGAGPDARVEVLDTAGRRIALLARDAAAAGWTWDGRDPHGRKAPPGDYLVRVTDGAHVRTARLVKLR